MNMMPSVISFYDGLRKLALGADLFAGVHAQTVDGKSAPAPGSKSYEAKKNPNEIKTKMFQTALKDLTTVVSAQSESNEKTTSEPWSDLVITGPCSYSKMGKPFDDILFQHKSNLFNFGKEWSGDKWNTKLDVTKNMDKDLDKVAIKGNYKMGTINAYSNMENTTNTNYLSTGINFQPVDYFSNDFGFRLGLLHANPNGNAADAKPANVKSEGVKTKEIKPEDAKPKDAKPEDAKPKDAKPEDAKPEDAKLEDAKPEDDKSKTAKNADKKSATCVFYNKSQFKRQAFVVDTSVELPVEQLEVDLKVSTVVGHRYGNIGMLAGLDFATGIPERFNLMNSFQGISLGVVCPVNAVRVLLKPNENMSTTELYWKINNQYEVAARVKNDWKSPTKICEENAIGVKCKANENISFSCKLDGKCNGTYAAWVKAEGLKVGVFTQLNLLPKTIGDNFSIGISMQF